VHGVVKRRRTPEGRPEAQARVRREAPNNPFTAKLSALLRSCIAQKACDLPSWQIPLVACDEPLFCTLLNPAWRLGPVSKALHRFSSSGSPIILPFKLILPWRPPLLVRKHRVAKRRLTLLRAVNRSLYLKTDYLTRQSRVPDSHGDVCVPPIFPRSGRQSHSPVPRAKSNNP